MEASERKFREIISAEGNNVYRIPRYQRPYSWTVKHCAKLLSDIMEAKDNRKSTSREGHFIGSIICVKTKKPNEWDLVDGQQRMITISLMLATMYKEFDKYSGKHETRSNHNKDIIKEANNIKSQIKGKLIGNYYGSSKLKLKIEPSTQKNNLETYKCILAECRLLKESDKIELDKRRLMFKAYDYFLRSLLNEKGNSPKEKLEELISLYKEVNNLSLVRMEESDHTGVFRLFETLNHRGLPLAAIDIIKNKFLEKIDVKGSKKSIQASFDKWKDIQNCTEKGKGKENRFLRQFYNAFKHEELVGSSLDGKATKANLISKYFKIIKKKKDPQLLEFLEYLLDKAEIYEKINNPDEKDKLGSELKDLNDIGATPSHTILMYLMSKGDEYIAKDDLIRFVKFLQKYFVRQHITNIPDRRDLDQLQIDVINKCEKKEKITIEDLIDIYRERKKIASLKDFKEGLSDNLYDENASMTKYLLIKLDEIDKTDDNKQDLWENGWSVEHILPQGENIPDEWENMIADGDEGKAEDIQEKWVHCLGNLTMTRYNPKLSNLPFEEKQNLKEKRENGEEINIGFKNDLHLNKLRFEIGSGETSLSEIPKWNEESIKNRTEAMVNEILKLYRFYDEEELTN